MDISTRNRALIEGLLAGLVFGSASILARLLILQGVDTYSIVFYRLIIGGLTLLIIILLSGSDIGIYGFWMGNWRLLILMSLSLSLHFISFINAVRDTYIINATVLVNTTPLITLILILLLKLVKVGLNDLLIVSLGFLGSLVMVIGDLEFRSNLIGDLEALIAALLMSIYLIIGRMLRFRGNILLVMSNVYLMAAPITLTYIVLTGSRLYMDLDLVTMIYLAGLGLLPTAIGHTLYISSLKGLKPHETSIFGLLEPISASIASLILFNEYPSLYSISGSIMVFISILLISYRGISK